MMTFNEVQSEAAYRRGRLAEEAEQWRLIRWGGVIPPVPAFRPSLTASVGSLVTRLYGHFVTPGRLGEPKSGDRFATIQP